VARGSSPVFRVARPPEVPFLRFGDYALMWIVESGLHFTAHFGNRTLTARTLPGTADPPSSPLQVAGEKRKHSLHDSLPKMINMRAIVFFKVVRNSGCLQLPRKDAVCLQ